MAGSDPSVPNIAFFDLDKTILAVNSATLVFRRMRRDGKLGWVGAVASSLSFFLYGLGLRGAEDLIRAGAAASRGHRPEEIMAWYRVLWAEEVRQTIRPGARRAIEEHRRLGERVVLITSSTEFIAQLALEELQLDAALSPRLHVSEGRFVGTAEEPLCAGAGKVAHARRAAEQVGTRLEDCTFYTDSYSDLPLLEVVTKPVAVAPDQRLRRLAIARGWPIVDWN